MCSKWAGGLGGSWTAVRGTGSHIESTNGESQGVVPFLKMHNDQLVAVNQGGKRAGVGLRLPRGLAQRHPRVPRAAPQHRRRAPAHARHEHRVLDPRPVHAARRGARPVDAVPLQRRARTCTRPTAREFAARYEAYEARVAAGELHGETLPALELWKQMLKMLFETGHPWLTFKDPCNVRSPAGPRRRHPLEQPLHRDHAQHRSGRDRGLQPRLDRARPAPARRRVARPRQAARDDPDRRPRARRRDRRQLLPDRAGARPPTAATGRSGSASWACSTRSTAAASRSRATRASTFSDEAMEAIALYAYEASSDLAAERGTYRSYAGSKWDRGLLPQDTRRAARDRARRGVEVPRGGRPGLGAAAREDRRPGHAQLERARDRARPRRSRTSWAPRPASSRPTRTCSPSRTCPATSSCSTRSWSRDLKAAGLWDAPTWPSS